MRYLLRWFPVTRTLAGVASLLVLPVILTACGRATTPFQFEIGAQGTYCYAEIVGEEYSVAGMRLNLADGRNLDVTGFDLGIVNNVTRDARGLQVGIFNSAENTMAGAQVAFAMNGAERNASSGAQVAFFYNYCGGGSAMRGLQLAVVANRVDGISGTQIGAINTARGVGGAQIGAVYNDAEEVRGVQFGFFNGCAHISGVQVGVLNFNRTGFLPVFPLFNFSVKAPGPNPGY